MRNTYKNLLAKSVKLGLRRLMYNNQCREASYIKIYHTQVITNRTEQKLSSTCYPEEDVTRKEEKAFINFCSPV